MRVCPICRKGTLVGGGYSNRVRATKFNPRPARRRYPNLQWATLPTGGRLKICSSCIKQNRHHHWPVKKLLASAGRTAPRATEKAAVS